MKKLLISACALLMLAVGAYAAGTTFGTSVTCPSFVGDLTGGVTGNVTGDVTGDVTGIVVETATAQSVTNGQAVTLVAGVNMLTGIGGANDTTNTITIANVAVADIYKTYEIHVASASSNLIAVAKSGNAKLSQAFVGDNYDVLKLRAVATNALSEVSTSNN